MNKKLLTVMLVLGCSLQLLGCGSAEREGTADLQKSTEAQAGPEKKAPVYIADYQDLEIEGGLICSQIVEDTAYFLSSKQTETVGKYEQHIYSLKLGEEALTLLPVSFGENTYVTYMCADPGGNILAVKSMLEEGGQASNTYCLTRYTKDGTEILNADLTELGETGEFLSVQYAAVDEGNNLYLSGMKGAHSTNMVWILDKEGKQIGEVVCDSWIYAMFTLPNGKAAAVMTDREGKTVIQEIDAEKKSFGKSYQNLPDTDSNFTSISKDTILMTGNQGAYQYDTASETYEKLVSWPDCNMNGDAVRGFGMQKEGDLWAFYQESIGKSGMTLVHLTEKTGNDEITHGEKEKVTVVVGTIYHEQNQDKRLWGQVNAFNRTNEKYHIEVRNYFDAETLSGKSRLDMELMQAEGPDVIYLNGSILNYSSDISPQVYMLRGILEDLNPYFDGDETLRREDYLENILGAYELDDKLYGITPFFKVATVIGKASDVGGEPGWTMEEAVALMESKPKETEFFAYMSKDWLLYQLCNTYMNRLIDWNMGECRFDDGYFEQILELANRFPAENFRTEGDEEISEKIRNGKLLLVPIDLCAVPEYMMYHILFGGQTTFIGYPAQEGTGSYIRPDAFIGMAAGSENKEGAWEFIKLFLSEDYQDTGSDAIGFPILKSALEKVFESDMTPVYSEENGEKIEQTKYYYQGLQFGAASKEDIDAVMALIESADGVTGGNIDITNIVREEAGAYFEGQKSAKEVADIIQSRVQIYVNENR